MLVHTQVLLRLRCLHSHPPRFGIDLLAKASGVWSCFENNRATSADCRYLVHMYLWKGVKTILIWRQGRALIRWVALQRAHWVWRQKRLQIMRIASYINDGIVFVGSEYANPTPRLSPSDLRKIFCWEDFKVRVDILKALAGDVVLRLGSVLNWATHFKVSLLHDLEGAHALTIRALDRLKSGYGLGWWLRLTGRGFNLQI